jgi:hypothetical protein
VREELATINEMVDGNHCNGSGLEDEKKLVGIEHGAAEGLHAVSGDEGA